MSIFTSMKSLALAAAIAVAGSANAAQRIGIVNDNNSSSVGSDMSTATQLRKYDAATSTATDTTVTIPSTGYLPVKVSSSFYGPSDLLIVSINVSAKSTALTYNAYRADTVITIGASPYILVGEPGTYTLSLTSSSATLSGSSVIYWYEHSGASTFTTTRSNRQVYKFVNTDDYVGFARDTDYSSDSYKSCDFEDGEYLYLLLNSTFITNLGNPDSIAWSGPTSATTGVQKVSVAESVSADDAVYNLQGVKMGSEANLPKGIYIKGGRKFVVK